MTSAPDDLLELMSPLNGVAIQRVPTPTATSFENLSAPAGRVQRLHGRATPLVFDHIPAQWRRPRIVHLAPIADEVDPALARAFPDSLVGVTPQGWMRQWDQAGRVSPKAWLDAPRVLPYAAAVVMSLEDAGGDEAVIRELARQTAVLVATRGAAGCVVYQDGQPTSVPAPQVGEVDATGAGDIFAATFFARHEASRDAIGAARAACRIASDSVTRRGLEGVPKSIRP